MRFFLLFFLGAYLFSCPSVAQDMIVTQKGDTINCKILRVSNNYVHYRFLYEGEYRRSMKHVTEIKSYKENYSGQTNLTKEETESFAKLRVVKKTRFGIQAGWGYRLNKTDPNLPATLQNYINDLRSGFQWSADFYAFLDSDLGIGLKYSSFGNKGKVSYSGNQYTDDISINYIGISLLRKSAMNMEGNALIYAGSVGYISYKNEATENQAPLNIIGSTIGFMGEIGYDFPITKKSSFGFLLSLMVGSIGSFEVNGNNVNASSPEEREGVVRLDLSAGFRF